MTKEEISSDFGVDLAVVERFRDLGLITPKRMSDGTLVFSPEDGRMLQRLLLLEKMGFSENDFNLLRGKEKTLEALLHKYADRLEDGCLGKKICQEILEEGADLQKFDATKYLEQLKDDTLKNIFLFQPSFRKQVYYPWRRFFARTFDSSLYGLIWYLCLGYLFHENLDKEGFLFRVAGTVITMAMVLFIEPLLLNRFRTTPGKKLFGLRVEKADGNPLSYSEGLSRTWGVISIGEGFNIPIYNLVRLYKSFKLCNEEEPQPWDENISYTIKDRKWYRGGLFVVLSILYGLILGMLVAGQELPPNRGDITLKEFAENYNYYSKRLEMNENYYMDEEGQLIEKYPEEMLYFDDLDMEDVKNTLNSDGDFTLTTKRGECPELEYTIKDGYLTRVSFLSEAENEEHLRIAENRTEILVGLAFGCTDKEVGLFGNNPASIIRQVNYNDAFDFMVGNIRFYCDVEREGYEGTSHLIPMEDVERSYYKKNFYVTKEK